MNHRVFILLACVTACGSELGDDGAGGVGGGPPVGEPAFVGSYRVPVSAELAAAATFPVEEIHWSVAGGIASLSYALPRGLVGHSLRVEFSGPYDPSATELHLAGEAGTAVCTVSGNEISCYEEMHGLMPIETDYEVVADEAAESYAGPVNDRIAVAEIFERDPIGIADFDLDAPATEHELEDD